MSEGVKGRREKVTARRKKERQKMKESGIVYEYNEREKYVNMR